MYASSANRWGAEYGCPASVMMEKKYKSPDNEDRLFGIKCHEVAAENVLKGGVSGDAEVENVIRPYIDDIAFYIKDDSRFHTENNVRGGEFKVFAEKIHSECMPIVDFFAIIDGTLMLWELKTGRKTVEVEKNLQMVCGYSGIMSYYANTNIIVKKIIFTVIQPRAYHPDGIIRRWETKPQELEKLESQLAIKARLTEEKNPIATTGTHCYGCPGISHCPAAQKQINVLMEQMERIDTIDLSPEDLVKQYEIALKVQQFAKDVISSLETEMTERIKQKQIIPGYELGRGTGSLQWDKPVSYLKQLGALFNVELVKEKPITPLQAIAARLPENLVTSISSRKNTGFKLTKINQSKLKEIFK